MKAVAGFQEITDLIGKAYDAALDPQLWRPFLESLATTCRADQALFLRREGRVSVKETLETLNLDLKVIGEWNGCKEHVDVWLQSIGRIAQGEPYASRELVPNRMLRKSGFYADILRPLNINYSLGGIVENHGKTHSFLAIYRRSELGRYEERPRDLLRLLIPHVQRALIINRELVHVRCENAALRETLDRTPFGVLILDAIGAPLFINQQADHVLSRTDGIILRFGQLKCWDYGSQKKLDTAIGACMDEESDYAEVTPRTFSVLRSTGQRPYQLQAIPLTGQSASMAFGDQAAWMVFIHDPEDRHAPSVESLQVLYGLTRAEARLCLAILETGSLEAAVHSLGVTRNTGKSQLARSFSKMDVSSQAELLQLLAAQCATPVGKAP